MPSRDPQPALSPPPGRLRLLTLACGLGLAGLAPAAGWDCHKDAAGAWVCEAGSAAQTAPARPKGEAMPRALAPVAPQPATPPAPQPAETARKNPPAAAVSPPTQSASEPPPPAAEPVSEPPPAAAPPQPPAEPPPPAEPAAAAERNQAAAQAEEAVSTETPPPAESPVSAAPQPPSPEPPPAAGETPAHETAATAPETPAETKEAAATTGTADRRALLDQGIPWAQCSGAPQPERYDLDALPIRIEADSVQAEAGLQQVTVEGDAELEQGTQRLLAQQMRYRRDSGELEAQGEVLLSRPDLRLAADQVRYNLVSRRGSAQGVEYRLPTLPARGTAATAELLDPARSRFGDIAFTTCPPDNAGWQLSAGRLELDTAEGLGTATDARLSLGGVPVAWLPTLTFPIDDRRRSGVLIPSVGYGDRLGLDLSVPYYFNLAPNYDLTLTPRLMSRRGLMLSGEFRFLTRNHRGRIDASFLPHDRDAEGRGRRGSLALRTDGRYGLHLSSALRLNYVSDDAFLSDFGSDLELTSASHLERAAELRYASDRWLLLGRVQHFQTLDPSLPSAQRPYTRLPQLLARYRGELHAGGLRLASALDAEFVNFRKTGNVPEGRRLDLWPSLALPLREPDRFLIPRAGLRYTAWRLRNNGDDHIDRLTPILSLDAGLYYDRPTRWFGRAANQSLEPRLFYLWVPYEDQSNIPLFDTADYDFRFDNLFLENRFNGADRQGDANQLTLALTTRITDQEDGRELFRASLGGIGYLRDRKVRLTGTTPLRDDSSALAGELAARLGSGWRARGGLVWNPNDDVVEQALARISYRGDADRIFSAGYRLRDGLSTSTDLGLIWPLGRETRAIARWNYSLSEHRNLDAVAGIEYGRCCWRLRALLRQQVTGTGDGQNLSFLLQLELKGLGKLGDNIDALLNDGIYGYRREDD